MRIKRGPSYPPHPFNADVEAGGDLMQIIAGLSKTEIDEPVGWHEMRRFDPRSCCCAPLQRTLIPRAHCTHVQLSLDFPSFLRVCGAESLHSLINWWHELVHENEQVDLCKCVPLLNALDAELEKIALRHELLLPLPSEERKPVFADENSSEETKAGLRAENERATRLVQFITHLLRNSMNKDVYSSGEVRSGDVQQISIALRCFVVFSLQMLVIFPP
jgi:hypothetical protein